MEPGYFTASERGRRNAVLIQNIFRTLCLLSLSSCPSPSAEVIYPKLAGECDGSFAFFNFITMQIKQEFKNLIPPLSEEEFNQLEKNILEEGIREEILTWRGYIIDGHNRFEIAQRYDLEYRSKEMRFDSEEKVKEWMILNQFGRRNLSNYQRSVLALELENIFRERAKANMAAAGSSYSPKEGCQISDNLPLEKLIDTKKELAKVASVSHDTIAKVKKIQEKAAPEIKQKLESGEVSINQAYQEIRKEEKKEERIAAREEAERKTLEAMQKGEIKEVEVKYGEWVRLGRHRLYCGKNTDEAFIKGLPQKVEFAFSDPPYNAGVDTWDNGFVWEQDYISDIAEVVAVTPGISALNDFLKLTNMPYKWAHSTHISNGMTRGALGFGNFILTLIFSNKKSIHRNSQDIATISISNSSNEEHYHKGRKPLAYMVNMISLFTEPGDYVIDNFLGSGTTLFCCEEMDRTCYAAESDLDYCKKIISKFQSNED